MSMHPCENLHFDYSFMPTSHLLMESDSEVPLCESQKCGSWITWYTIWKTIVLLDTRVCNTGCTHRELCWPRLGYPWWIYNGSPLQKDLPSLPHQKITFGNLKQKVDLNDCYKRLFMWESDTLLLSTLCLILCCVFMWTLWLYDFCSLDVVLLCLYLA